MVAAGGRELRLERGADAFARLGGSGIGEGDDEQLVKRRRVAAAQTIKATRDEGARFAGPRAGHDEHVAAGGDGALLGRR